MERANSIQIVNTCHALAQQGIKVYLLVRKMNKLDETEMLKFYGLSPHTNLVIKKIPSINVNNHFIKNKSFYVFIIFYMVYLLITRKIDLFLLRDLALARVSIFLRTIFRFRIAYEVHMVSYLVSKEQQNLFPESECVSSDKITALKRKEAFVFRHVDAVFAITEGLKKKIADIFSLNPEKIAVIRDAVNTGAYKEGSANRSGLIYVGQLYPWKGVDILIEAMQYIEYPLTVIGGLPFENDLERLKDKTLKLGLEKKVTFLGFLPPCETVPYLQSVKVAVIPLPDNIIAREYTSPLKLFEAMAAQAAVVASDLPSIREIITHERNGVLVTPGEPKLLAEAVNRLLQNKTLYDKIVSNAYKDVQHYSWQKRAQKICEVLETLWPD